MDTYRICALCHSDTYYNCVKCHKDICSTSVDESHTGYSEDHPKAVSIFKLCSGSKKDSLVYLHFFSQGSYFLLSANAKMLVDRSL